MSHVFLSYAREDAGRVRSLVATLERDGHTVWWDQHVSGGHEFAAEIEKALDRADVVVVVWSSSSIRSPWVRDEAAAGRDNHRLVPVTFDGAAPPLGFRQFQTIDLSHWSGRSGAKALLPLRNAIREHADKEAAPAAPRAPAPKQRPFALRGTVAAAAAAVAVLLLAGAFVFGILPGTASAAVAPTVGLGKFTSASAATPPQLLQAMHDEILAAFGSEHEVSLVTGSGKSAQFLLDGSVQKSPGVLHFTVNLTNTQTGGLVWSQSFDRSPDDASAPRQVAVAATQVVRCGIWGASAYGKRMSDKALSLYIDWCNEYWGGSPDEDRMLDAAKRVAAAIPDFSYAWSAVALSSVPVSHRANFAGAAQVGRDGWAAAQKAMQLDKLNPEGYMAEAGLLPMARLADREQLLVKAVAARPTECGCERQAYGDFLLSVGRLDEAAEQYDRARAMMPLAPMSNIRLAQALYLVGRHREADAVIARIVQLWPDAEIARLLQLKAMLWAHDYEGAAPLLKDEELDLPDAEHDALADTFAALRSNDGAAAQHATEELSSLAADPRSDDRLVVAALAALNANSAALNAADSLIRDRGPALADVLFEPNLAAARGDPQYAAIVQQLGLVNYWHSTGRAPDMCTATPKPDFCTLSGSA